MRHMCIGEEYTGVQQTLIHLLQENQRLTEQIQHQVRSQSALTRIQRDLDDQMHRFQRLAELSQQCSAIRDFPSTLDAVIRFVLYDLNFERGVLLTFRDDRFRVAAFDGYYDEPTAARIAALVLPLDAFILDALDEENEPLICTDATMTPECQMFGLRVGMDEYFLVRLGNQSDPLGLLIVGNTRAMASYHTRLPANEQIQLVLMHLVSLVTTALVNGRLDQALAHERDRLEQMVAVRTADLQAAQDRLMRDLATPLIPLSARVLLLPLIGTVDQARAQQMQETLLAGIERYRASVAIIDMTGVTEAEAAVALALQQTVKMGQLLGAAVILTGIGPTLVQTLKHQGHLLNGVPMRGNLQQAIDETLAHR